MLAFATERIIILAGDAINEYYLLSHATGDTPRARAAVAVAGLERVMNMSDRIDRVFNFHHDYRAFGQPLAEDAPGLLLEGLRALRDGRARFEQRPGVLFSGVSGAVVRSGRVEISTLSGRF